MADFFQASIKATFGIGGYFELIDLMLHRYGEYVFKYDFNDFIGLMDIAFKENFKDRYWLNYTLTQTIQAITSKKAKHQSFEEMYKPIFDLYELKFDKVEDVKDIDKIISDAEMVFRSKHGDI